MEQLQASFRKGETLRATAEKAKCSPGTVYAWFQRFKQGWTS
jgi:transposase